MKRFILVLLFLLILFCCFTSCTLKQHPVIYCKYHTIKKRLKKRRTRKYNYHSKRKENYEKARAKNKKYTK